MNRLDKISRIKLDLLVIGGGIIGTGIARDAAMRGLKVALLEMGDFGHGTSSRSTRLIHGGLRYLEQLDFGLVREDLRERELLLHLAPHLVHPLPFMIPLYGGHATGRAKLKAGMLLYDLLSYDRSLPGHRWLSPAKTIALEPALRSRGLKGAFIYYDALAPSVERLCIENVISARDRGALLANYVRVTGFLREDGVVSGVEATDMFTGERATVRASLTINATGPWLESTLSMLGYSRPPLLRRTKGVHLVLPKATNNALVLFAADRRLFFVVPWMGLSLVGTTDTDFDGDAGSASTTEEDARYLIESVRRAVPEGPWNQLHYAMAGVRALVRQEGVDESVVSRGHRLMDHSSEVGGGLISVVGGKITGYRAVAESAVDLACRCLGLGKKPSATAREPLPGGRFASWERCLGDVVADGLQLGLDEEQCRHLAHLYGSRAHEVLALVEGERRLGGRISPKTPDILAQVRYSVEVEMASTPADFLLRRSMLGLSPDRGINCIDAVCGEMGDALGWDKVRRASEVSACLAEIGPSCAFAKSPATGKREGKCAQVISDEA